MVDKEKIMEDEVIEEAMTYVRIHGGVTCFNCLKLNVENFTCKESEFCESKEELRIMPLFQLAEQYLAGKIRELMTKDEIIKTVLDNFIPEQHTWLLRRQAELIANALLIVNALVGKVAK